jgi:hypothetical protein
MSKFEFLQDCEYYHLELSTEQNECRKLLLDNILGILTSLYDTNELNKLNIEFYFNKIVQDFIRKYNLESPEEYRRIQEICSFFFWNNVIKSEYDSTQWTLCFSKDDTSLTIGKDGIAICINYLIIIREMFRDDR